MIDDNRRVPSGSIQPLEAAEKRTLFHASSRRRPGLKIVEIIELLGAHLAQPKTASH